MINSSYRIDGGVSRNDFVAQLISDITQVPVERPQSSEMSVLGAAYLAGLAAGVWNSQEELIQLRDVEKIFKPRLSIKDKYEEQMKIWKNALTRFLKWYPEQEY